MQSISPPCKTAGSEKRRGAKPQVAVSQGLSNKDSKVIKKKSNKELAPASQVPDLNALIELFEPVNPTFEKLFSNKTQRKALERLVLKFGFAKIDGTIRSLPEVNETKYAPTITRPTELEDKLGALVAYYKKNKSSTEVMKV